MQFKCDANTDTNGFIVGERKMYAIQNYLFNADVRLCVSCANFGSWHSYELEQLRTLRSYLMTVCDGCYVQF